MLNIKVNSVILTAVFSIAHSRRRHGIINDML